MNVKANAMPDLAHHGEIDLSVFFVILRAFHWFKLDRFAR